MNKHLVQTDSFVLKKRDLRIYRVLQPPGAALLWLSERQAAAYVQRIHIEKLLANKKI